MGRKLMRVPMDFAWPMNQVWKGYVNPYRSMKCQACDGTGLNPATKELHDTWYDYPTNTHHWCDKLTQDEVDALVAEGRLRSWNAEGRCWETGPRTAEEVNAANRRGSRSPDFEHDCLNRWICIKHRARRLGVYGECTYCSGEGELWQSEDIREAHEAWEPFDPPPGDGYQLWETTSEGSPVSPVFESFDVLCDWCAEHATTFGSSRAIAEEWKRMLDDGHVYHQVGNAVFM